MVGHTNSRKKELPVGVFRGKKNRHQRLVFGIITTFVMLRNNMMDVPNSGDGNNNDWYNSGASSGQGHAGGSTRQQPAYNNNPYQQQSAPQPHGQQYSQQQAYHQQHQPSYADHAAAPVRYRGGAGEQQEQQGHDFYTGSNAPNNSGMDGDMDFKNKGLYGVDEDFTNEPPLLEELGIHFDHIWLRTLSVLFPNKDISHLSLVSKMSFSGFSKFVFSGGKTNIDTFNMPTVNAGISIVTNKELDSDLTGPILYCLLLGWFMLFTGKANFGYIYGFSVTCSIMLHQVIQLLYTRASGSAAVDASSPSKTRPHDVGGDSDEISIWETCSILGYSLIPVVLLAAVSIIISLKGWLGTALSVGAILWSTYSATRLFDVKMLLRENHQFWLVAYPVVLFYACFTLITVF